MHFQFAALLIRHLPDASAPNEHGQLEDSFQWVCGCRLTLARLLGERFWWVITVVTEQLVCACGISFILHTYPKLQE